MSDDLAKQSIAELQDLVRCRCHPAYKDRGLHDPDCECDNAENVKVVADHIEELEAELNLMKTSGIVEVAVRNPSVMEYMKHSAHLEGRAETAEAKLAEAVDLLNDWRLAASGHISRYSVMDRHDAVIASLQGDKK